KRQFLATSFWHLVLSRYGFRAVTQPLMQALTIAALWRGFYADSRRPGHKVLWTLLAGFFCGLAGYTYLAVRVFPFPLALTCLSLLLTERQRYRALLGQMLLVGLVALLTLAPLIHYWATHPGSFTTRAFQVAPRGWSEVWRGIVACAGMFFLKGDPYIRFNIPTRPIFGVPGAVLLVLGLIVLCAGCRSASTKRNLPLAVFLLSNLILMILPSALATGEITPSNLRTVGLLPFIYVFPALGLWWIARQAGTWLGLAAPLRNGVAVLILLAVMLPISAQAYFGRWASSAELYYAADGDLVDMASYLNQADLSDLTPYVASVHYRHPTLAFLARDYGRLRWLTGGRTVVLPAQQEALWLFPRSASDDLAWVESMLPANAKRSVYPGPDGTPAFHVYQVSSLAPPQYALSANFGYAALLRGYTLLGEPRSGGSVEIAVWWEVLNRPERGDYIPFARLSDRWGFTWGETLPFHYPSEQWQPGEVVVDHLSIPIHPGAPPGAYLVRFGFYSPGTDAPLPVLDEQGGYAGTYVELPIHLSRAETPPPVERLAIARRLDVPIGALRLLGFNLDTTSARPGEPLHLTLFWRADASPAADCHVTITANGLPLYRGAPVHGTYPTSLWSAGEVIVDRYNPPLPRDMPPGVHTLRAELCGVTVDLGTVAVEAINRSFALPSISHPLHIRFGEQVMLLGYELAQENVAPGEKLALTLYWQALREMEENYTVFVHLIAPDGTIAGQRDSWPVNGTYPTSLWMSGEVVTDSYEIEVPLGATPGMHRLEVGLYVAATGKRLEVSGSPSNAVTLQTIAVVDR
ncbi:MAG: hypothetical protein N2508_03995, partial [Anaerolineae bacterium]|nr:hypothetical protein [Anaerolineae bacterium]